MPERAVGFVVRRALLAFACACLIRSELQRGIRRSHVDVSAQDSSLENERREEQQQKDMRAAALPRDSA